MDLLTWTDIIIQAFTRLGPVWVSLVILFLVSFISEHHRWFVSFPGFVDVLAPRNATIVLKTDEEEDLGSSSSDDSG